MKNGLIVDKSGTKWYYHNDLLHREDGPAIEHDNGEKHWLLNGKLHRVDGPAIESADGNKSWYNNGRLHRVDGPAVMREIGVDLWVLDGFVINTPGGLHMMADVVKQLNNNEEYSLSYINEFMWAIEFINNPTSKQTRLHAMKWKI